MIVAHTSQARSKKLIPLKCLDLCLAHGTPPRWTLIHPVIQLLIRQVTASIRDLRKGPSSTLSNDIVTPELQKDLTTNAKRGNDNSGIRFKILQKQK